MKSSHKSLSIAVGALLASAAATPTDAQANPFGYTDLAGGYMQAAQAQEAKCGGKDKAADKAKAKQQDAKHKAEGKCGEGKCGEGKCGEGKCGGQHKAEAKDEAKAEAKSKDKEGKCGEGKCGEGQCGAQ